MSLAVDTSPSLHRCAECRMAFETPRGLRRHVALDHTADPAGTELVAALTRGAPEPHAAAPAGGLPVPGPYLAVAGYALLVLLAVSPLLATSLLLVAAVVTAHLVARRGRADRHRSLRPRPRPQDPGT